MRYLCLLSVVLVTVVALVVPSAHAGIQAGAKELQLFGSLNNTSYGDSDNQTIMFGGTANNYVNDTMSVGIVGVVMRMSSGSSSSSDTSVITVQGRADLYMSQDPTATSVPYIGGDLGITAMSAGDYSSSTMSFGFHGGIKVFNSENTSINLEAKYNSYTPEDAEESVTETSLNVGLSVYFF